MTLLVFVTTAAFCLPLAKQDAVGAMDQAIHVGFGEADITPRLEDKPVYMAGFGQNRKAAKVHDPLMARAVVLSHEDKKIAVVSIDVVGFFHPNVARVRQQLPGFTYVLVSSTHNHEGPDTLGLWGPTAISSGVDKEYMKFLEGQIVKAVRSAEEGCWPAQARIGTARAPELLHDGREPYIKHDELVGLKFIDPESRRARGIIVQWNCHPETLGSKNTELSADYVGYTVRHLVEQHGCPVVYLTGTVGGLMTSLKVDIKDEQGHQLADGTFEKTERYGRLVGQVADKALAEAKPVRLAPFQVRSQEFYIPLDNKLYQMGRQLGVLDRAAYVWAGDCYQAAPADAKEFAKPLALKTETAWLRLGELDVACIPGEIYPELVLEKVQDPADAAADFPQAPIEPAIYKQLPGPHRMIVGLANDEIGYILPKRQWDVTAPYCYGRAKAQYGETNSAGPETGPILCRVFQEMAARKK
jgi:hypothetical protein